MIRVLVVDDHAIVRSGLERLLGTAEDLELVGQAEDGRAAIAMAQEHAPDVVLMDLSMPEVDGVEATREITRLIPTAKVVPAMPRKKPKTSSSANEPMLPTSATSSTKGAAASISTGNITRPP